MSFSIARYERVEDILRLAIEMQNSYQGFSIQDIQDEFDVSRRTAIRMKDAVERLFPSMEEVENPLSRIKKWRLNKTPLSKMISFTAAPFKTGQIVTCSCFFLVTPNGVNLTIINGARRWLNLGFFQFQPSEFSKLALIMLLGNLFSLKQENYNMRFFKYLLTAGLMIFVVLKQPNLSMTLILLGISFCMYICSGKTLKPIFIGFLILCGCIGLIATNIIDLTRFIEPYQIDRILNWIKSIFAGKSFDIQGGGYQAFHSMVAISSGGLFGCGYGGSKEKLGWLPEAHTDFIFSVISEEIGFIGSLFIILLFLTLLYRGVNIAYKCPNLYGRLLAIGITFSITMQAFFNISVATE